MESRAKTRAVGMLGFAMRAGKVVIGTDLTLRAIASRGRGRVELVLVTSDASEATRKRVFNKCEFYKREVRELWLNSSELGDLLGKAFAPVTVGVADEAFATEIKKAIAAIGDGDKS